MKMQSEPVFVQVNILNVI